ncbi:hypothetical protein NEOLEDRAFT_900363 [Neolentinus lepideus HHB14362 ss-1]|uniref:Uncharacterized protein n=1 Tax=Neolentinus lepideus HHB14362 ss-1 TaxID=1314782 RepID=A0A165NRU4_9AGAM|nr:hypothetical protein NEOLEDRAFT_900363 [Neolentinus lepideus HHB14362 ss-1]
MRMVMRLLRIHPLSLRIPARPMQRQRRPRQRGRHTQRDRWRRQVVMARALPDVPEAVRVIVHAVRTRDGGALRPHHVPRLHIVGRGMVRRQGLEGKGVVQLEAVGRHRRATAVLEESSGRGGGARGGVRARRGRIRRRSLCGGEDPAASLAIHMMIS